MDLEGLPMNSQEQQKSRFATLACKVGETGWRIVAGENILKE